MKVLIVARCKARRYAPFITEQVKDLTAKGLECKFYGINKNGLGYLAKYPDYLRTLKEFKPDIVHAHYGISGLFANLQRKTPVVTTYHGSDINFKSSQILSRCSLKLSSHNIFVSERLLSVVGKRNNCSVIPCGVNPYDFPITDKAEARKQFGFEPGKKLILFAGSFSIMTKNPALAQAATAILQEKDGFENTELLEFKGYSRSEVPVLLQAVDAMLMTSVSEGSPQVIKEAMICGCPIVSVDVGDVKDVVKDVEGCYISDTEAESIAECLAKALSFNGRTDGRNTIYERELTGSQIADRIIKIYEESINRKK